jgi:hypothetical protein
MSRFERELSESLKRKEPPAGFANKVIARAHATDKRSGWGWSWKWAAAAALVMVIVGGGVFSIREQRRQAENEQKKEQLMAALRITGSKLRFVEERLAAIRERTINLRMEQE